MKKWSGERLETFVNSRDSIEHLHRYAIVSDYVQGKVVLDVASGEGYGSNFISNNATFVYGVDIDDETIQKAKIKYKKSNLEFITASAIEIPLETNSIDVVVSFETIEHHDKHNEMIAEIKRVLKPNGLLVISTPDKLYYSDYRNFKNNFHVKELYKDEFVGLITTNFKNLQLLNQKYTNGNSVIQDESIDDELKFYTGNYMDIKKEIINPVYLVAIASDSIFDLQKESLFDGSQIMEAATNYKLDKIYNSTTYRLGHLILSPFKKVKALLK